MATPKNINIEFNATGNLKDVIKAIAKEYQKFQKQSNEVSKATKKLSNQQKFSAEILKDIERRNKLQTQQDVERVAALKKKEIAEKKAAEAAKKHAQAQKILAVNADVNKKRIRQLNVSLKKVGKSFKDTAITTDVLKRAMKGNAAAMSAVNKASKHLLSSTKKLKTGLFNISNDGRLLSNTFATLRSKMLLAAFAATTVTTLFVNQVRAFGKQEASVRRLADVFGNEGAKRLDEYSSALQKNSTFGDENINIVMSQIGAFGASEEQTKKLMQATIDLSAGIGIDLNSAGLLVAKTIGSSTDALTRYGVGADGAKTKTEKIANVIESIDEKFGGLGKMLAQTTEGQLAQAANAFGDFQENIGEALAPTVLFLANTLKVLSEALNTRVIKLFIKSIIVLTSALIAQRAAIVIQTKATIAYKVATMGLTRATRLATVAFGRFSKTVAKNKIGVFVALLGSAIVAYQEFFNSTSDADEELEHFRKTLNQLEKDTPEHTLSVEKNTAALKEQLAILNASSEIEKMQIKLKRELTQEEINLMNSISAKKQAIEQEAKILKERENHEKNIQSIIKEAALFGKDRTIESLKEKQSLITAEIEHAEAIMERAMMEGISNREIDIMGERLDNLKETHIAISDEIDKHIEKNEKLIVTAEDFGKKGMKQIAQNMNFFGQGVDISAITTQFQETVELFENEAEGMEAAFKEAFASAGAEMMGFFRDLSQERIKALQDQGRAEMEALKGSRRFQKMSDAQKRDAEKKITERTNQAILKEFEVQKNMSKLSVIMDTSRAIVSALANPGGVRGIVLSSIVGAMGAMQLATINAQQPPKMAQGGLIGGRRHSEGGTLIEAEQGEFVMNRNAVDAIGVETLNRMNMGAGAAVNVSFSGNVMSDDFIENEAIPKIREAVRRGSDIGVS
tara:strand:+ start:619 stop:3351 length:2733 start_codon:yes stop_codon:yes gene_type:complete